MRSRLIGLSILAGLTVGILTRPTPQSAQQGIADQVAEVRSTVVHVERVGQWQGSGCLISPDGILFSAKHVTDSTPAEYVVTLDSGERFPVKYVLEDRENDVSFMQLDLQGHEPNLPYAKIAAENTMRVGDAIFIFGSPLGKPNFNTVSLGILSAVERNLYDRAGWEEYRRYDWHAMLQTTSPSFPGNSGGPCFNMQCEVVGVLVAGQSPTLNFAVPIGRVRGTIDAVRQWFMLCRLRVVQPEDSPVASVPTYCSKEAVK
jgi:serine protease Do